MHGMLVGLGPQFLHTSMDRPSKLRDRYEIIGPVRCWPATPAMPSMAISSFLCSTLIITNAASADPRLFRRGSQLSPPIGDASSLHHQQGGGVCPAVDATPSDHQSRKPEASVRPSQRARDLGWREADIDGLTATWAEGAAAAHRKGSRTWSRASPLVRLALFYRWT